MSDDELRAALEEAEARLAALEAARAPEQALEGEARELLARLSKQRRMAQHRGVRTWDEAPRGALRMVVLSVGCVALGTGAWALDSTLGGASLVASLVVLAVEGLR